MSTCLEVSLKAWLKLHGNFWSMKSMFFHHFYKQISSCFVFLQACCQQLLLLLWTMQVAVMLEGRLWEDPVKTHLNRRDNLKQVCKLQNIFISFAHFYMDLAMLTCYLTCTGMTGINTCKKSCLSHKTSLKIILFSSVSKEKLYHYPVL